ncbi:MAG TPA: hypothetical protein VFE53_19010 [Mucilaginibacter sp.]|jgi:hypothetical protein|nr:hypothetical protein [Mucilaginibacter sp.]
MITPQYTYDHTGNKVGVFLPIEDWDELSQVPGVKELAQTEIAVPDWQIELGKKELQNVADGTAELMEWSEAKKHFKL